MAKIQRISNDHQTPRWQLFVVGNQGVTPLKSITRGFTMMKLKRWEKMRSPRHQNTQTGRSIYATILTLNLRRQWMLWFIKNATCVVQYSLLEENTINHRKAIVQKLRPHKHWRYQWSKEYRWTCPSWHKYIPRSIWRIKLLRPTSKSVPAPLKGQWWPC